MSPVLSTPYYTSHHEERHNFDVMDLGQGFYKTVRWLLELSMYKAKITFASDNLDKFKNVYLLSAPSMLSLGNLG